MTQPSGDDVCGWIEAHCFAPEGRLVGKPIKLAPFQREFIEAVYDNPAGTRRAILSMGRKCAKTTLSACLLLNHLCGPSARDRPNSQLFSCAQSREQAGILFSLASKMVKMNPVLASAIRIQETAKSLSCAELGTRYRALSSEASTAQGLSPQFCVFDELGQTKGVQDPLYESMETATAAIEDPLTIVISTQCATDDGLLSALIDDALQGHDPRTIVRLFSASAELDPFSTEAIEAANPAFRYFQNQAEIRSMAEVARRMPAREAEYRNKVLNQRVEVSHPFVSLAAWRDCGGQPRDLIGLANFAGLDLSEAADLTAFVVTGKDITSSEWSVRAWFWLPKEGIVERSLHDRVPYDEWARRGLIELTPGKAIGYDFVATRLRQICDDYPITRIAFDRHNMRFLKPHLAEAGFSDSELERLFVEHGQGFVGMSPAIRDLETTILDGKLRHGNNPVLTMCMANCTIETDPAGNRKFNKKRARGRIDGAVALAMALSAAPMSWARRVDVAALIG